jgi:hypothetical protein
VPDSYRQIFTDRPIAVHRGAAATLRAAEVFEHFPVAILARGEASSLAGAGQTPPSSTAER